jgi:hypothetical protein
MNWGGVGGKQWMEKKIFGKNSTLCHLDAVAVHTLMTLQYIP